MSPHPLNPVFLHGQFGRPDDWGRVVQGLDGIVQGLDAACPALPGHAPGRPVVSGESLEAAVERLWASLPSSHPVDLVGYSLGGRFALAMAAARPDQVRSVALIAASPGITDPAEREDRLARDHERAERLRRLGLRRFLHAWYRLPLFRYPDGVPAALRKVRAARADHDTEQMAMCLEQWSPGRSEPHWDRLPAWAGRGLYLAGAWDAAYAALAPRFAAEGWATEVVAESAHDVHLAQPDALAGYLADFWERLE